MHSSRAAFSSLQTQQGYPQKQISFQSTLEANLIGFPAGATKGSHCREQTTGNTVFCNTHAKEKRYTFTAAVAVPGSFKSEAIFAAVVGAAEWVRICKSA